MGVDNIYYVAAAGSPAAKPFTDWLAAVNRQKDWVSAFEKKHKLGKVTRIGLDDVIWGFKPAYKTPCSWTEAEAHWRAYIEAHPLWRRVKPKKGSDYLVPRKDSAEGKALACEWASRPRPGDPTDLGMVVTGVKDFMAWLNGMSRYYAGWRIRDDQSVIVVVPYHVTKAKQWKPLAGLKRGNQDKLRTEWHEKED